jgi:hypothetical protein
MIDPQNIFKRFASDNPHERETAAHKLYENFKNSGGHPDDWELYKKGSAPKDGLRVIANLEASLRKNAEAMRDFAECQRKRAEAAAAKERKAREKADAENAKLREQLNKAKEHANDECADLFSSLLPHAVVDKLSAEQIAERMQGLFAERECREYNLTAQVDLVIGQLTEALYQRHATLFGKRKRGSNAPTVSEFLETHAGKSASWCRRCYKAYMIVITVGWDGDATGGIEGIIKSASDPNKPKIKRVSKVQQRLDALTEVVRRKDWEDAERLVNVWDSSLA